VNQFAISVGQPSDGRFAFLRGLDESHNGGEQRVGANSLCFEHKRAGGVERARTDAVAGGFELGHWLAREHRLVDLSGTAQHATIHGNSFSSAYSQSVAGLNPFERNVVLLILSVDSVGGFGREGKQRPDGRVGPGVGTLLEDLTEQHHDRDERDGFEVEWGAVGRTEIGWQPISEDQHREAEQVGCAGTGDDEREHVGVALADGAPPTPVERRAGPEKMGVVSISCTQPRIFGSKPCSQCRRDHRPHRERQHR
jgi:hypothetical protein